MLRNDIQKYLVSIAALLILSCRPAYAALTATALINGSSATDGTSFTTASVTPSSNALVFVAVWSRQSSGTITDPTLSNSNGVTSWALEDSKQLGNKKVALFRGMTGSASAGTITINYSATQSGCMWSVFQVTGTDTGGSNGSGAIVQNPTATSGTGTSSSITLSAFGSSNNMAVGVSTHDANSTTTVGSGFTRVHDVAFSEHANRLATQYKLNQTAVSDSWAASNNWIAMAVEVKAAVTASYTMPEGRFTGGGGNSSTETYQVEDSSFDLFSNAAMSSAGYALETKVGIGGKGIGTITSLTPGDFTKFYSDGNAAYTVAGVSQDGDSLQYSAKQGTTIKVSPQSFGSLSWSLNTPSDLGRHTMSIEVIDPDGTSLKKQEAYVVRRPTK